MTARIIAVVGSGTGVGKTAVARRLSDDLRGRGRSVACLKPFVSGRSPDGTWSDLVALECEAGARFEAPLSPLAAVRTGEHAVDPAVVLDFVRARADLNREELLIVEGIGGVLVPLAPGMTWLDWHAIAGWPAVVVGSAGLGTINHMLLTIAALATRRIPLAGFILSETLPCSPGTAEANAELIAEFSGVVPLGILHYDSNTTTGGTWDPEVVERLEEALG